MPTRQRPRPRSGRRSAAGMGHEARLPDGRATPQIRSGHARVNGLGGRVSVRSPQNGFTITITTITTSSSVGTSLAIR